MPRHLVCLTFDFDALSSWIYRSSATPTQLSRGEFALVGADRILRLLDWRGIKATWFVPGHTLESFPEACARIHSAGHEIGHHGYLHEPPAALSREQEDAVLRRGIEAIRQLTGAAPRGYRSPSWDLSPHSVELLLAHGFHYDSSMMAQDYLPYRCRQGGETPPDRAATLGKPTRLVEMPISWSLDDYPVFEYVRREGFLQEGLRPTSGVLENWLDDFRYMARELEWGVITYTFHPEVTGRGHRMLTLERLIDGVAALGATFVRMDEAAEEYVGRAPFDD